MNQKIIVAVDGFSSSGKSTMAKLLAQDIKYRYVDSGAMYRAITLYCLNHGWISGYDGEHESKIINEEALRLDLPKINISFQYNSETKRNETLLNGDVVEDKIRELEVSNNVSIISALPFVRAHLVFLQQEMGKEKGIVMDGRDIGSVVFPDAELKFFITATPEIRAQRRFNELESKGNHVSYEEILENIIERDYLDQNRKVSPLVQVKDAILFDNSNSTIDEQRRILLDHFNHLIHK